MEQTLRVEGMTCDGCEGNVRKGLLDLGAQEVSADHTSDTVRIAFDPSTLDLDRIRARIEELGFDVVS